MKKAIIIGATSGIGKALSYEFASHKHIIGIAGRRLNILKEMKKDIATETYIKKIDITRHSPAMKQLKGLIREMKGVDIIIINSAVHHDNEELDWGKEKETVDTNVLGFLAMVNTAAHYFMKKGSGHIVGISSIASLKYSSKSSAYCASKAFVSNYIAGIRELIRKKGSNVILTEILPGFVDTQMIENTDNKFWVSTTKKAARQIYQAVLKKKKRVFVSRRWKIVAGALRVTPDFLKRKVF